MPSRFTKNRAFLIGLVAVSACLLIASGGVLYAVTRPGSPVASPRAAFQVPTSIVATPPSSIEELAERFPQLADLLRDPALDSVYKDFMVAYQTGGVDQARRLAEERGLLSERDEVRITLVVDSEENVQAVADELQGFGIVVEGAHGALIDIAVPMSLVERFAERASAGAMFEQLTQLEHVVKLRLPVSTHIGETLSEMEGVAVSGADAWHEAGYTGKGVKIGVLDLGFTGYLDLLGKQLPENVVAKSFVFGTSPEEANEVHGAAVAEVVHAMAPDAELYLAYYSGSEVSEGRAVDWLLEQGVDIITHSATSLVGPMDGTGSQAETAGQAAAQGVLWVNCTGNYAFGHYRGTFTDSDGNGKHEFPNGEEYMGFVGPPGGMVIIVNWDDWERADQDFDLYIYDSAGDLVASSQNSQGGQSGDAPFEAVQLGSPGEEAYYLSIEAADADRQATFDLYVPDGEVQFPSPAHSLGSPSDAQSVLSVGAVNWQSGELEDFSSQGPTNDGRIKPDISAPDAVTTASYGAEPFYGTSASTPHVAGAAALVMSAFPDFAPEQVIEYLTQNAIDQGDEGLDPAYGYGSLHLPNPASATAATDTPTPTEEAVSESGPTSTPRPTKVALAATATARPLAPKAEEGNARNLILLLLGGGLCLGFFGILGGVLLLVALRRGSRPQQEAVQYAPPPPAQEVLAPGEAYLLSAEGMGRSLSLGETSVGRSDENDVVLADDDRASRHHAAITWDGSRCTITDFDSTNGTFVNGRRLPPRAPQVLYNGDQIRFGSRSTFTVQLPI